MKRLLMIVDFFAGQSEITKQEWLFYAQKCLQKNNINEWARALAKAYK